MLQRVRQFTLILLIVISLALPGGMIFATPGEGNDAPALMPFDVDATAAFVMEPETGSTLYAKNADDPLPPASITKMMTQLLAFEALQEGRAKLDDIVVISEKAWRLGGSTMFLNVGQEVTFGDLLVGISVVSANDACIAVAEHLTGSEELFVKMMNERAATLGMTNTRFENSTGLPSAGHYMSARDIALLGQEIVLHQRELLQLESQISFTFNDISQKNRNPLLGRYTGADGLKTGWTNEAGFCLAATAVQNDIRLIAVALGTESESARLNVTRQLLDYGFRNFVMQVLLTPGEIAGEVPLLNGRERELKVTVAAPLKAMVPAGQDVPVELVKNLTGTPTAPISQGDKVGMMQVVVDGYVVNEGALVAAEDVRQANIFVRGFRFVLDFFKGLIQKIGRSE
jgi:serine-type D-Ala-D-Ala carboxypeptidase (penicillin-binding protein 5/6)